MSRLPYIEIESDVLDTLDSLISEYPSSTVTFMPLSFSLSTPSFFPPYGEETQTWGQMSGVALRL